jgi:hypothetical protein
MGCTTFREIFLQTHLVTLAEFFLQKLQNLKCHFDRTEWSHSFFLFNFARPHLCDPDQPADPESARKAKPVNPFLQTG